MSDQENTQNGDPKITKAVDKLVMGIIVGGAVGSVLGMMFAPKTGKQTRKIIKERGMELLEKGKEIRDEFVEEHGDGIEEAKEIFTERSRGVWGLVKKNLLKNKKEKKKK